MLRYLVEIKTSVEVSLEYVLVKNIKLYLFYID